MPETDQPHYLRDDLNVTRAQFRKKKMVDAELILQDGDTISGQVYLNIGERILDMLNSGPGFFPVRLESGEVLILNKSCVAVCKPLDEPL